MTIQGCYFDIKSNSHEPSRVIRPNNKNIKLSVCYKKRFSKEAHKTDIQLIIIG
jgi:hypothetical protein